MTEKKKPETHEQRVSYGFGWQFGRQMHKNMFEGMDIEMCVQALRQCFAGEQSMLTDDELNEAYDAVKEKRKEVEAQRKVDFKDLCEIFLQKNGAREGVVTTASGLQYEILEAGEGPKPNIGQSVLVHYHGSFIDGQVFDSSITRNEAAEFSLDQVIPGWTEALLLMPQGSKWRVAIPYQLAYGELGAPPAIPPFSALIFEMHLLKVLDR
jgi:FKBP-type peptidyl-prolyl cis-trans isomerase FklB